MRHVVFVDSTVSGLLAFEAAKLLNCQVTFIHQMDTSFLTISLSGDLSRLEPYLAHVDNYLRVDSLDGEGFHALLERINSIKKIDALITTSEAAIIAVAREAKIFGTQYADYDSLCNTVYKDKMRKILLQHGISSPDFQVLSEHQLLDNVVPSLAFPFVIKPTRGFAKQFSAVCMTKEHFDAFVGQLRQFREGSDPMVNALVSHDYLVEQYIAGTLHSAEVVVQRGKVSCYATTIRFRSSYNEILEMTATMPSGLSASACEALKAYVQQVFTALNLDVGLYHVELLRNEEGIFLVEVNARMMGSVGPQLYKMLSGIDPFELLVRLHLGESITIDDSVISKAGTVVAIASRNGGQVSMDYNPEQLQILLAKYQIEFCTAHVWPGQPLNVYSGNIGTIGHVIILDDNPYEAARKGNLFLSELSVLYGNELALYTGDEIE